MWGLVLIDIKGLLGFLLIRLILVIGYLCGKCLLRLELISRLFLWILVVLGMCIRLSVELLFVFNKMVCRLLCIIFIGIVWLLLEISRIWEVIWLVWIICFIRFLVFSIVCSGCRLLLWFLLIMILWENGFGEILIILLIIIWLLSIFDEFRRCWSLLFLDVSVVYLRVWCLRIIRCVFRFLFFCCRFFLFLNRLVV